MKVSKWEMKMSTTWCKLQCSWLCCGAVLHKVIRRHQLQIEKEVEKKVRSCYKITIQADMLNLIFSHCFTLEFEPPKSGSLIKRNVQKSTFYWFPIQLVALFVRTFFLLQQLKDQYITNITDTVFLLFIAMPVNWGAAKALKEIGIFSAFSFVPLQLCIEDSYRPNLDDDDSSQSSHELDNMVMWSIEATIIQVPMTWMTLSKSPRKSRV